WAAQMIDLHEAWEYTKGKGVKICIIDDGIELSHTAFSSRGRYVHSRDILSKKKENASHKFSMEMHGTACASIACSADSRAPGVAPEADLLVVRTKGLGSVLEAEAILWAVDQGADIISCSWGPQDGRLDTPDDDDIEHPLPDHTRLAIEYARKEGRDGKGCLIFFAAGNGKEPVANDGYAAHPGVMAIGSVNKERKPTIYSDRGYPLFCCFPSSDFILREGEFVQAYGLVTADRLGIEGYSETDYFSRFGGTSASCPGMAGAAALMLSIDPDLTASEARNLLINSCIHPAGNNITIDEDYGHGIINCHRLVQQTIQLKNKKKKVVNNNRSFNNWSLHIALNEVDEGYYGSTLALAGCHNDADYYHSLCISFDSKRVLKDEEATRAGVTRGIEYLVQKAKPGDQVIITYAGHGSLVEDISGDEADDMDETLVLYDGFLIDDEINNLLAKFDEGVDIIWISDSCHSGSNTRSVIEPIKNAKESYRYFPAAEAQKIFARHREFYKSEFEKLPQSKKNRGAQELEIKANLLTLAAVMDSQLAADGDQNGLFTQTLKDLNNTTDGNISYAEIINRAQDSLPFNRQPVLTRRGRMEKDLEGRNFFEALKGSKPQKPEQNDQIKEVRGLIHESGIVIKGQNTSHITMEDSSSDNRSISNKRSMIISQNTIDGTDIYGDTPWDKAYHLAEHLQADSKIDFVEPDMISAVNAHQEKEESRSSEGYIDTYPDPVSRKNKQPIIWHLDDDHSQLKSAFEQATAEVEKTGGLTDQNRDTFPLIVHIDTGILGHHPTTPPNYREDMSEEFRDPIDKDLIFNLGGAETQGHGHATITLLAGNKLKRHQTKSDYKGYLGAFPYARVATLRISDSVVLLSGKLFAKAVYYAVDKLKADVITMSMAGAPSLAMKDAVNHAYDNGVLIVSAAGNNWTSGLAGKAPKSLLYP
ncbi:MAG: S8 family serine peptidase, partial [Saprospiraceae bacterium]|nr:S8 family serine peptidase [Saprospiraceae bacterium]